MKLIIALALGCVLLHQAAAQCTRVVILMNTLPSGNVNPTGCPTTKCYYYTFAAMYNSISTLGLTMNDALVFVPTSTSSPKNTAAIIADTAYVTNLAANTNLYVLTSNLEASVLLNLANNKAIMGLGVSIPTVHIVDYNAYITAAPAPAVAAQNPCSFLATSPPTLSGACAYPVSTRVVILTDQIAPYPNLASSCLGSCFFYNTGSYLSLSMLGLGMNDALVIIPTPTTAVTTTNVITFSAYLTNLSLNTNVYVFTTPVPATNGASIAANNALINAIPASFPRVIVKNFASYSCPANLPPGSCACNYIATGWGG